MPKLKWLVVNNGENVGLTDKYKLFQDTNLLLQYLSEAGYTGGETGLPFDSKFALTFGKIVVKKMDFETLKSMEADSDAA